MVGCFGFFPSWYAVYDVETIAWIIIHISSYITWINIHNIALWKWLDFKCLENYKANVYSYFKSERICLLSVLELEQRPKILLIFVNPFGGKGKAKKIYSDQVGFILFYPKKSCVVVIYKFISFFCCNYCLLKGKALCFVEELV